MCTGSQGEIQRGDDSPQQKSNTTFVSRLCNAWKIDQVENEPLISETRKQKQDQRIPCKRPLRLEEAAVLIVHDDYQWQKLKEAMKSKSTMQLKLILVDLFNERMRDLGEGPIKSPSMVHDLEVPVEPLERRVGKSITLKPSQGRKALQTTLESWHANTEEHCLTVVRKLDLLHAKGEETLKIKKRDACCMTAIGKVSEGSYLHASVARSA
jgi:hypothetical protein